MKNYNYVETINSRPTISRAKILVIEDSEDDYILLVRELSKTGISILTTRIENYSELRNSLQQSSWDIVISDNNLPGCDVNIYTSFQIVEQLQPGTPFIIVSGTISEHKAIEYMNLGVTDYILKSNIMRMVPLVKRILKNAEDQSRKAEIEKKIAENDKRFKLLAQNFNDVFFIVDKEIRCTYWNMAAELLTGIKEEQALGQNIFQLFPDIRGTKIEEGLMLGISTYESQAIEFTYNHKGRNRHYKASIYPSYGMYSIIIKDVTKSVRTEEKLKDTNDELETFMYRVSHDIRGPVASLMGLINLAKLEPINGISEYIVQGEKITNRLDDIVTALSDVTRIRQENAQLKLTNIRAVFQKVHPRIINRGKRKTKINFQVNEETCVKTDPKLLEIIFEKIMQNAVDYKNAGDNNVLNIRIEKETLAVKILFEDNGVGINEELFGKIFNMFFRGNINSKGSGLGLYLVKQAVEKLKGSITVASTLNEGSTFTVTLPHFPADVDPQP